MPKYISCVAPRAQEDSFVAGSSNGYIYIFDQGKQVSAFKAHDSELIGLTIEGFQMTTVSSDCVIKEWYID